VTMTSPGFAFTSPAIVLAPGEAIILPGQRLLLFINQLRALLGNGSIPRGLPLVKKGLTPPGAFCYSIHKLD